MDILRTRIFMWLIYFLSVNNGIMIGSMFCGQSKPGDVNFTIECIPSRNNGQTSSSGYNPSVSVTQMNNVTNQTPPDADRMSEIALPIVAGAAALIPLVLVISIVIVVFRRKHRRPKSKSMSRVAGGASGMYDEAYAMRDSVDNVEDGTIDDKVEYHYIDNIPHQSDAHYETDATDGLVSPKTGSLHIYDYTSCSEISGNETIAAETNIPTTSTYDSVKNMRQSPEITDNEYSKFEEDIENGSYNSINTHSKFVNKNGFAKSNQDYSTLDVRKTTVKPRY